jgi:hypothetical protein
MGKLSADVGWNSRVPRLEEECIFELAMMKFNLLLGDTNNSHQQPLLPS